MAKFDKVITGWILLFGAPSVELIIAKVFADLVFKQGQIFLGVIIWVLGILAVIATFYGLLSDTANLFGK